jgi:hypothetical protein
MSLKSERDHWKGATFTYASPEFRKKAAAYKRARANEARREKRAQAARDAKIFKAYPAPSDRELVGKGGEENVREGAPIPLAFGLSAAVPTTAKAAWGSRMIFQFRDGVPDVGFVMGRSDLVCADGEEAAKAKLAAWVDEHARDIIAAAELALRSYTIRPSEAGRFVIFEDERGRVVGNTNASHGYLYVAGWLKG